MKFQRWGKWVAGAVCGVALVCGTTTDAKETSIADVFPSLGRSVRSLGMGNVGLTLPGDDPMVMFYNPAALQDLPHSPQWMAPSLTASINKDLIATTKDVLNMLDDLDNSGTQTGDLGVFETFFNKRVGQFQQVEVNTPLFAFGMKGWGAALLLDSRTTFSLRNRAFPNFEMRTRNDGAVAVGKSIGLWGDDLAIGVMAKGIYRVERDKIITTNEVIANTVKDQLRWSSWGKGIGFGGDVGVRWRLPFLWDLKPVVAVTYQDIGNTRFRKTALTDTPQSLNAAIGFQPKIGDVDVFIEASATQLNQKRDLMTRLHAGAEVRFPQWGIFQLSLRGGTNQGYASGGFTVDLKAVRIDGAFFGEEIGDRKRQGSSYKYAVAIGTHF
ncbi:MAG: hypothetical protein HY696_05810 [Deltaproteobacteria bacterium]|nr:hypothetical protein [Deltaproteobacteria bacterium]